MDDFFVAYNERINFQRRFNNAAVGDLYKSASQFNNVSEALTAIKVLKATYASFKPMFDKSLAESNMSAIQHEISLAEVICGRIPSFNELSSKLASLDAFLVSGELYTNPNEILIDAHWFNP